MTEVKTIFIVDDDPMQADMLKDYMSKYSTMAVKTFNSGEECIKNLNLNPQIIFLDFNFDMAGKDAMNGVEVLKEIKSLNPSVEVVMFSGQDKIEVAVNTMKYGAFDYVVKNESAFHRSENILFNIIRKLKLQREASSYKKLTYLFAAAFFIMLIVAIYLYSTGRISDNPGWF